MASSINSAIGLSNKVSIVSTVSFVRTILQSIHLLFRSEKDVRPLLFSSLFLTVDVSEGSSLCQWANSMVYC